MRVSKNASWWGPPRKFDPHFEERRISWLELFYDLVYVIAISRITYHLTIHINPEGFLEYAFLFMLVFWGWLNGSLYHDIHGGAGLRTRLMTLWQVMIIAALTVTIDQSSPKWYTNTTVVFIIMQLYITYMWWSVGIYDKSHRRYSRPYIFLFLVAAGLMALSFFVPSSWLKPIAILVIICNYSPQFIAHRLLRRSSLDLSLSSSMAERLGLFTIIVFGEVVLGIVNGATQANSMRFEVWLNFAFAISIVFALWWIFFTLTANRNARAGFIIATLLELFCIPTLMALGIIAVRFRYLLSTTESNHSLNIALGCAIAGFLTGVTFIMRFLDYPNIFNSIRRSVRLSLLVTAGALVGWSLLPIPLKSQYYLLVVTGILVGEIVWLNLLYYSLHIDEGKIMDVASDPG